MKIKSRIASFIIVCMIAPVAFTLLAPAALSFLAPDGFALLAPAAFSAYAEEAPYPEISAQGAAVYCRNTGEIVYSKDGDKRFCPYSITKILTAYLAVQKLPLDMEVTVSEKAASIDESSMYLEAGEVVTIEELLYGTLIMSGNDAAYALGEAVSGNMDDFLELMNSTIRSLGCKNTYFSNPNGLSDNVEKHYTTANDMVRIAKLVFSNPTVRTISGTKLYEMRATNLHDERIMETHNEMLKGDYPGFVAGKTGYWGDDSCTIVMDYRKDGLEFIAVILEDNIEDRAKDCNAIVNYALANIEGVNIVRSGDSMGMIRVKHGEETRIETFIAEDCLVYLPKAASVDLVKSEIVLNQDLTAPVVAGEVVGKYQAYLAGELVNEVDIIAGQDVAVGWFPSYIGISNRNAIILAILLSLLIILIIVRAINKARMRRRRRKARKAKVRAMARDEMRRG